MFTFIGIAKSILCSFGLAATIALFGLITTSHAQSDETTKQKSKAKKNVDDSDDAYDRAMAERLVRENCLMCHSEELIISQRLTAKQWKAEVEKMVGWGSPLPAEHQQAVIDHLAKEYSSTVPARPLTSLMIRDAVKDDAFDSLKVVQTAGDVARGAELFAKNCANCHGPEGMGAELGTNLLEKPILYRKEAFARVTREGRGRMPGFASTLDARAEADMLSWLRTRQYRMSRLPK